MSTCRSCGASIRWITSEATGKVLPVDPEMVQGIEDPEGSLRLMRSDGKAIQARRLQGREPHIGQPFVEGYVSHFVTCPHAKAWRKES